MYGVYVCHVVLRRGFCRSCTILSKFIVSSELKLLYLPYICVFGFFDKLQHFAAEPFGTRCVQTYNEMHLCGCRLETLFEKRVLANPFCVVSPIYHSDGLRSRCSDWLRAGRSGVRIPVGATFSGLIQAGRTQPAVQCIFFFLLGLGG